MGRPLRIANLLVLSTLAIVACAPSDEPVGGSPDASSGGGGGGKADQAGLLAEVNHAAGRMILYEVQVRAANACRADTGADWQRAACADKIAPEIAYHAEGMTCGILPDLEATRLGTLDDLLEDTADFREGITLRYIQEKVGANTVWLMPLFPNNDTWNIPDACDNLGSPYAVRDYMHVRGTLSRRCILQGRDERSPEPCYGNDELFQLVERAHERGMKVMLDVAFNHLGHNYNLYDYMRFRSVRDRTADGEALDDLWDFAGTFDPALLDPDVLDTPAELSALAAEDEGVAADLGALSARCPSLAGADLVRAFAMWRVALDGERERFPCEPAPLEQAVPGFYLGANHWDPSKKVGDNYSNDWKDVKFLYHQETNVAHRHELAREREVLFRILNYWTARGVDAFRLDHTTDAVGGMAPNEWRYILSKVVYYANRRGQARPVFLAEEFHDQQGMSEVVDVLTEGYVRDMCGRDGVKKDASHVEWVVSNMDRFNGRAYVMAALETHDEDRLTDETGFDPFTGAGFWGIGATTSSTPMILMGQEIGEPWGLGFRRSDLLRSRFEGTPNAFAQADGLLALYRAMATERLEHDNRALLAPNRATLRARDSGKADARIFAQVKWSDDGNVVFVFHNLWRQAVAQSYFIPEDLGGELSIDEERSYRLVDVFSEQQLGPCRTGADLKWSLPVEMDAETRMQWLRLETCG